MPNWIEGVFRARGKKENIQKFLMEGLVPAGSWGSLPEKDVKKEINDYSNCFEISWEYKDKFVDALYIKKTKRSFLECGRISTHETKDNNNYMFAVNFKAAWSIDIDAILAIAEEYKIDIRVNGYEMGMEFEQLIEVDRDGNTKCDSCIEYQDYTWECPMPLLGG